MTEHDLYQLVENIVAKVLERLEKDPEFAAYLPEKNAAPSAQWVRTCSTFRADGAQPAPAVHPEKRLYCERDIIELIRAGNKELVVSRKTIITPAARDAAAQKGLTIRIIE